MPQQILWSWVLDEAFLKALKKVIEMCWIYSCLTDILGLGSTGNSNQSQVFHKKLFGAITFESLLLKNLQTYLKREFGTRRGLFQAMCLFLFRIKYFFESRCCARIPLRIRNCVSKRAAQSFHVGGRCHIETSPLICSTSQWTGFYMISASIVKGPKQNLQNSQDKFHGGGFTLIKTL